MHCLCFDEGLHTQLFMYLFKISTYLRQLAHFQRVYRTGWQTNRHVDQQIARTEHLQEGRKERMKSSNQHKRYEDEFALLKTEVCSGIMAIPFEKLYFTNQTAFKVLESLRTRDVLRFQK